MPRWELLVSYLILARSYRRKPWICEQIERKNKLTDITTSVDLLHWIGCVCTIVSFYFTVIFFLSLSLSRLLLCCVYPGKKFLYDILCLCCVSEWVCVPSLIPHIALSVLLNDRHQLMFPRTSYPLVLFLTWFSRWFCSTFSQMRYVLFASFFSQKTTPFHNMHNRVWCFSCPGAFLLFFSFRQFVYSWKMFTFRLSHTITAEKVSTPFVNETHFMELKSYTNISA